MADISTGDIYMEKVEFKKPRLIIAGHNNINKHSLSKINDYIKKLDRYCHIITANPDLENEEIDGYIDAANLTDYKIRNHFLIAVFCRAEFRAVKKESNIHDLVRFQSKYKLLLMTMNEPETRKLGRIVANPEQKPVETVLQEYEKYLDKVLQDMPAKGGNINVLMHAFGYFSEKLSSVEKETFLDLIERYRNNKVYLSLIKKMLKSWITQYNEHYLADQRFFYPYPEKLRNMKKI